MKMKKENMEHIRQMVEAETGVELPVKEGPELHPYIRPFLMTAAALLCVAGLGLIWYKVSADKQKDAGAPLASESETEEAVLTDNEGNEAEPETEADPETEVVYVPVTEVTSVNIFIVDLADDPSRALVFFTGEDSEIKAEELRANQTWVWPVKRGGNADGSDVRATDSLMLTKDYYLSIPGAIGEDVHMMHNGEVTDCGFDAEKGNYISTSTEGGFIIEYRHLDEIRAAKGDQLKAGDVIGTLGNSGMSTG
ncbi:MAG: M23 family metallopeptidase, partial [Lachnospiraceae bacterium]|nr:M23 family metallopeptidase [Lachnospiraceae bacterium]